MIAMTTSEKFWWTAGRLPKKYPAHDEEADPEDPAADVVAQEPEIGHRPHPGHERREGPDDRDEAGEDDGPRPVPREKGAGPIQVARA